MAKQHKDRPNPYIGHIQIVVSDGENVRTREELDGELFDRIVLRTGIATMFHMRDVGMYNYPGLDGWELKPVDQ